ncbi:sensor histidine kinase [Aminicella lysinilytica]|uniref:sensor histidine kinase n=1 Tax=Aminicella lysinilytica TaxID=433323 RepID=UPI0026EA7C07|nr:sensor histidine kinase [Aminicella lysinilytica]
MHSSDHTQRARLIFMIAIFTTIMSQIRLDLYNENFIVSLGPICIPVFIYLFDKVDIIPAAVVSAAFIYGVRLLIHIIQNGSVSGAESLYLPEAGFYVLLGIFLYIFDQLISHRRKLYVFIPGIMVIDYLCNNLELFMRIQLDSTNFHFQWMLIAIAGARGLVLLILLLSLDRYRIMLFTKTHAQRYSRLIMLMSKLSGEVIWMNKNMGQIEDTMSKSYKLYDSLLEEGDEERAKAALDVAKDVHEIKKEYRLIGQGLSDSITGEINDQMEATELFTILVQAIQTEIAPSGQRLLVGFDLADRLYMKDPYWFLSVFRNLIGNALEATAPDVCTMQITEHIDAGAVIFSVSDNGPGVDAEYADHIFEPRFSTKIDYETGAVNRGLGLPIVKGIIEENLGGSVCLAPSDHGARFLVSVPVDKVEVLS